MYANDVRATQPRFDLRGDDPLTRIGATLRRAFPEMGSADEFADLLTALDALPGGEATRATPGNLAGLQPPQLRRSRLHRAGAGGGDDGG